jgi:ubiquinone/menaquinone biosynthesis C-methylase UbiE
MKRVLKKEKEFHDHWATEIDINKIDVDEYFESSTAPENRFILKHMGDFRGKKILDLGCGAGENSVYFAKKGAHCIATDYSPGMVEIARQLAKKYKVTIEAKQMDAMHTTFKDSFFDYVYASNLLHHVNPKKVIYECHRILKPGGKLCFWDPLKHNPAINIYRKMATKVRTKDEHPLDIAIVGEVKNLFSSVIYDTFWLSTLWIFIQFFMIEKVHPNQERYWKKIIYDEKRLRSTYFKLEQIDTYLKKIPLIKKYAWNLAVVATK